MHKIRHERMIVRGSNAYFSTWCHRLDLGVQISRVGPTPAQHSSQGEMLPAHRLEQVDADLITEPLARLPSGRFGANDVWSTCAAIAHNPNRGAGHLSGSAWSTTRPPDRQATQPRSAGVRYQARLW